MKLITLITVLMMSLSVFSAEYFCKSSDDSCGFSTIELGEIQGGKLKLSYDLGIENENEEVIGVDGIDRECSDRTTLSLCVKTDNQKKLVISQEDGVEGTRLVLNKKRLTLEYQLTNLISPFKFQVPQKTCQFSCVVK